MKNNRISSGYSLLEVMLAVTITLILGSMVTMGMRKFMVEKSIEKEAVSFWKELCSLRAKAMKDDVCYFVTFNTGGKPYQIWKDDGDCDYESGEDTWVPSAFLANIEYGIPEDAKTYTPGPDETVLATTKNIDGEWLDSTFIRVANDDLGSINSGRVCLWSSRLDKIGYCIQLKAGTQNIKLFKWNGDSWLEM